MSVIVKGMEMPKKAMFAAIFPPDDEHGAWYISVVEGKGKSADYELTPLPEKHGRLIDGDGLKETLDYYIREAGWDKKTNRALGWVKDEFIDSEPTVVEAEGE